MPTASTQEPTTHRVCSFHTCSRNGTVVFSKHNTLLWLHLFDPKNYLLFLGDFMIIKLHVIKLRNLYLLKAAEGVLRKLYLDGEEPMALFIFYQA